MTGPAVRVLLDWRDSSHWSKTAAPCWHCGAPTHLRDDEGRPSDKTCAEAQLSKSAAATAARYENGTL